MSHIDDIRARVEKAFVASANTIYPPGVVETIVVQRLEWERRLAEVLDLLDLVERAEALLSTFRRYEKPMAATDQWLRDVRGEDA